MQKRKLTPFSVQSDAKTKNEIEMRFSKWGENEKRNSNLFFRVGEN